MLQSAKHLRDTAYRLRLTAEGKHSEGQKTQSMAGTYSKVDDPDGEQARLDLAAQYEEEATALDDQAAGLELVAFAQERKADKLKSERDAIRKEADQKIEKLDQQIHDLVG